MALVRTCADSSVTSSLAYYDTNFSITAKKAYFSVTRGTGDPSLVIDDVTQTPTGTHSETGYTTFTYEAENLSNASVVFSGRATVVTVD